MFACEEFALLITVFYIMLFVLKILGWGIWDRNMGVGVGFTNNAVSSIFFMHSEYLIQECLDRVLFGTYIFRGGYLHGLSCSS